MEDSVQAIDHPQRVNRRDEIVARSVQIDEARAGGRPFESESARSRGQRSRVQFVDHEQGVTWHNEAVLIDIGRQIQVLPVRWIRSDLHQQRVRVDRIERVIRIIDRCPDADANFQIARESSVRRHRHQACRGIDRDLAFRGIFQRRLVPDRVAFRIHRLQLQSDSDSRRGHGAASLGEEWAAVYRIRGDRYAKRPLRGASAGITHRHRDVRLAKFSFRRREHEQGVLAVPHDVDRIDEDVGGRLAVLSGGQIDRSTHLFAFGQHPENRVLEVELPHRFAQHDELHVARVVVCFRQSKQTGRVVLQPQVELVGDRT